MITLHTNYGDITLELNHEKAPKTAANFEKYVKDEYYNETIFHRVIDGFMIQGGGFTRDMTQKDSLEAIKNEADNGLTNDKGTVAMARTADPHSASSQFFINVSDNDFLNHKSKDANGWGYCVFAKVVDGMDTVEKIKNVQTANAGMHQNVPVDPVVIEKTSIKAAE